MKAWVGVLAATWVTGCTNVEGVARQATQPTAGATASPSPAESFEPEQTHWASKADNREAPNPKARPDSRPVGKIDPRVVGTYRLELTPEQRAQIEDSLAALRRRAKAGDSRSQQMLSVAEQAAKAAENMTLTLGPDGTFASDISTGPSRGRFTMQGSTVALQPDERPSDPSLPNTMAFQFDPVAKTLTADQSGQRTVFRRVK